MRIVIQITIVLAAVAGAGYGLVYWWQARAVALAPQTPAVRVELVTRGDLVEFISAPGEVEPRTKVAISARVAARIIDIPYKEGAKVTKGRPDDSPPVPPSILVKLDDKELDAALKSVIARRSAEEAQLKVSEMRLASTRARIDATRIALADAKRELARNRKLLASKDVSQATVDQLEAKVDQQEAELASAVEALKADEGSLLVLRHNLEAAAAEIDKARDNLSHTVITSPIDGTVTRLASEIGEMVVIGTMNAAGTVIMEVADLSQMIVRARVDENAIAQVKPGQKCKIRMEAYRDRVFEGTVTHVALANFDPQYSRGGSSGRGGAMDSGRHFRVEVLIDTKDEQIFSGLSADVDIQTAEYKDVLKIPSQAVLGRAPDTLPPDIRSRAEVDTTKASIPVVFRYLNGEAVATPVTIGASDYTHIVIKSGLKEGDPVITGPYKVLESLQHGQKLKSDKAPASQPATTRSSTRPGTTQATSTQPATIPATREARP